MFDLHGVEREHIKDSDLLFNFSSISIDSDFKPFHSSTPSGRGQQNKQRSRPLRLLNVNFQSVVDKKAETLELLDRLKPDIVFGTETWLHDGVKDSEILSHHYKLYRKDRKQKRGGGVLIAIKEDLQTTRLDSLECDCETIWLKVLTRTQKPVYISVFYRPDFKDTKALEIFQESLKKAAQNLNAHIIVAGDFNLPHINWNEMKIKEKANYVKSHADFLETLEDTTMQQMVLEPTRLSNTLDLVLTNTPDLVPRIEVIPGLSDHSIVYFEYNVKADKKENAMRNILLYKKAKWDEIKKEMQKLETEIENMINSEVKFDINQVWEKFKETLLDSMDKHIPKKRTKQRDSYPWITPEIRKKIKRRDRLSKIKKKRPSQETEIKFKECRREVKRLLRKEYWNYVCNLFEEHEGEVNERPCLKRFWTYIKHQRSSSVGVSPLKSEGKLISDPQQKAEILNNQFYKSFSEGLSYSKEQFDEKCTL